MSHDRDHDHHLPSPPREEPPLPGSEPKPDRERCEHPTIVPREPVDPRSRPSRRGVTARLRARPL